MSQKCRMRGWGCWQPSRVLWLQCPSTDGLFTRLLSTPLLPATHMQAQFPAFFSPDSGLAAPERMDSPEQVARLLYAGKHSLGMSNGYVIAVPNPSPAEGKVIEEAISAALGEWQQRRSAEGREELRLPCRCWW